MAASLMAIIISQSFSFLDWADYAMQVIWLWAMTLSNVSNNFDYELFNLQCSCVNGMKLIDWP